MPDGVRPDAVRGGGEAVRSPEAELRLVVLVNMLGAALAIWSALS